MPELPVCTLRGEHESGRNTCPCQSETGSYLLNLLGKQDLIVSGSLLDRRAFYKLVILHFNNTLRRPVGHAVHWLRQVGARITVCSSRVVTRHPLRRHNERLTPAKGSTPSGRRLLAYYSLANKIESVVDK